MDNDYIAVPTGLGPMTKDQTIQYLLDRIEALELDRERLMAEVVDRSRDARREALEEAAREIECGCPDRDKVPLLPPNGGKRWRLCGEANCRAINAAAIRALIDKD